ncbi:McrB family protein [Pseudidiomarina sp. YC-516-91]|uniref:McrB family protein n=1 Tax=Pseudidiomarina salilacus TaxID=3384452 RepID=UPI00398528A5
MLKDLRQFKPIEAIVNDSNLGDFRIPQDLKVKLNQLFGPSNFSFNDYTSFTVTDKESSNEPANYALIPNQYLIYASRLFDLATELFKYIKLFEKLRHKRMLLLGTSLELEQNFRSPEFEGVFEHEDDIALFARFMDKDDTNYRLGAKRLINDNGVPRGGKDCFGSVVLKVANLPDSSSSIFGALVYELCSNMPVYETLHSELGKQEFAPVLGDLPIKNRIIRDFVYAAIKHLVKVNKFARLANHLEPSGRGERLQLASSTAHISSFFRVSDIELTDEVLSTGGTRRWFNEPFTYNGTFHYLTNQWTDTPEESNHRDINNFKVIFEEIFPEYEIVRGEQSYTLKLRVGVETNSYRIPKPFLLLAGISGTGKTRFVRKQASEDNALSDNYQLVAVRPDWHEPSDLLGYVSRLGHSKHYVVTDVLKFISKTWKALTDSGLKYDHIDGRARATLTGSLQEIINVKPHWLCLDEMNLAPVEQYFADYLSVLETRNWEWDNDTFLYETDALLSPTLINQLNDDQQESLREDLGLKGERYNELWEVFTKCGIGIPPNLIVAGTVNMDETTHGFSRKVIDRALTFDFGEFYPNDFNEFFHSSSTNVPLSFPLFSQIEIGQLPEVDSSGYECIRFLSAINQALDNTPFQLAYRALNELLLSVVCFNPQNKTELRAVWDDFLMMKVLPRIEGDADKLNSDENGNSILTRLSAFLAEEFSEFWNAMPSEGKARPDLLRKKLTSDGESDVIKIACRSKRKLEWMQSRLNSSGFTSFWP